MAHKKEAAARLLFTLAAAIGVAAVLAIVLFLLGSAVPTLREIGLPQFLFGRVWSPSRGRYGIAPMLLASLYVTVGALVVGVPPAVLFAIFLTYYCPKRPYRFLRGAVGLLAGIPSIVYGLFGLTVLSAGLRSVFGGSGKGLLTASVMLGLMILPTVVSLSEEALRGVPRACYEGALALGASRERSVFSAVLPAASTGILSAVILGMGRAVGETMAVVMVAGNQAVLPRTLTGGLRTLTANIVLEMGYATGLHRRALIACGAVLLAFILLIDLSLSALKRRRP